MRKLSGDTGFEQGTHSDNHTLLHIQWATGEPCFCGESTSTPITMCLWYTYLNCAETALWSAYISYQNKTLNNPGLIKRPSPPRAVGCLLEAAGFLHCFVSILKPLHWGNWRFYSKRETHKSEQASVRRPSIGAGGKVKDNFHSV